MLSDEKGKTAKLRASLITNLTSLIVDFTDTQDRSWSEAVSKIQTANDVGVEAMQSWLHTSEQQHAGTSKRAADFATTLDHAESSNGAQRVQGSKALDTFTNEMRVTLQGYGEETARTAEGQKEVVDGFCTKLGGAAKEGMSLRSD